MSQTVEDTKVVTQTYTDFTDGVSTLYGNGYDKCGPRVHYLALQVDSNEKLSTPDSLFSIHDYMTYKTNSLGPPITYKFDVITADYKFIGNHDFTLNVGLLLYPTATKAQVTFRVTINPCIVTSYTSPADYKWDYVVGNRQANYIFNYI